jgi:hypothetical protein
MEAPFKFDIITSEYGSFKIKNDRDLCLEFEFIEDEDDGGTVLHISKIFKCGDDSKYNTREMIKLIDYKKRLNVGQTGVAQKEPYENYAENQEKQQTQELTNA